MQRPSFALVFDRHATFLLAFLPECAVCTKAVLNIGRIESNCSWVINSGDHRKSSAFANLTSGVQEEEQPGKSELTFTFGAAKREASSKTTCKLWLILLRSLILVVATQDMRAHTSTTCTSDFRRTMEKELRT